MALVARGDEEAYGRLLRAYWEPLVRYADSLLNDEGAAEDVAQEAFLRVWLRRREWKPVGRVTSFLYRMIRNLCVDHARSTQARVLRVRRFAHDSTLGVTTPDRELELTELQRRVESAVNALPARRREVFLLTHHHSLTYREVGEIMGISAQTVANQMSSALQDLRGRLSDLAEPGA
jgi:RNA polymerase sigma-70 factor (ECF subfamily)